MREITEIINDVTASTNSSSSKVESLAKEIEFDPEGHQAITRVLSLFESHPKHDFGMPGPLAHAIEAYYGNGYEEKLLESIDNNPTSLTLWLTNRIINAEDHNKDRFLEAMQRASFNSELPEYIRDEATDFLSSH